MLHKEYRLPLQKRNPVFATYKTPYFIVKMFRSDEKHPRFGFIVSKTTAKNATSRNRVKRQIRSVVEQHLESMQSGYDILIIVQKAALGAETKTLADTLLGTFKKLNILS